MEVVIFDIDGTLADNTHRQHHLTGEKKDWDAFYEGLDDDKPIEPVLWLARGLNVPIIYCTGRPERYRERTMAWLCKHGITPWLLYARCDDDHRPDHIVKREMLTLIRAVGFEPLFVVDDRKSVVDMWRSEGLICLQCAEGDF